MRAARSSALLDNAYSATGIHPAAILLASALLGIYIADYTV